MRTTSKEFKEQVRNHIKDGLLDEQEVRLYEIDNNNQTLLESQLKIVIHEFNNWYGLNERKLNPNKQDAFTNWLDCLPSCLSTEFEYYNVHETMKKWYNECGMVYKYDEPTDKEYQLYKNLIYREFRGMLQDHKLTL